VLNRTVARAEEVAELAGATAGPIETLRQRRFDVIINATPVGMQAAGAGGSRTGAPQGAEAGGERLAGQSGTPFPTNWLVGSEVVFDMVYRPRITPLLAAAGARGCPTIEGLEMFVRQAAVQYGLFTSEPTDRPLVSLRAAALRVLEDDR
jgi:shikimate 5-dehydrogenase